MKNTKPKPKIGPLYVWVVGHPQNPLLHGDDQTGNLAVFYKRKEAIRFRQKHPGTFYKVYKAVVIRGVSGPDYKAQRDAALNDSAAARAELTAYRALMETEIKSALSYVNPEYVVDKPQDIFEAMALTMAKLNHAALKARASTRDTASKNGAIKLMEHQRDAAEAELAECIGKLNAKAAKLEITEAALAQVNKQIHDGKIVNTENPRWTPRTKSALALAEKEAQAQGATYVGTEHLLLGMLKQGEGVAKRHFLAAGMSYEKAEYAMRVGRCS